MSNGEKIGFGESAAIALAIKNNGIVASNNLRDVAKLCYEYDLPIITASMILSFTFELNFKSKNEIKVIWKKIINETRQKLPKRNI